MKEFKEQIVSKIIDASADCKIIQLKDIAEEMGINHITHHDVYDIQNAVAKRLDGYRATRIMNTPNDSLFQSLAWLEDGFEFEDEDTLLKKDVVATALGCYPDDISNEDVESYEACDYLTENTCRNDHNVLWYHDGRNEACYDLDDERFLTEEEIEEQLC